jgi:tetratricopeptide (TPR) repeat protein
MSFYYQPLSDRSYREQWQRSLDERNLVHNIDDIVKTQTAEYNNTLREVSEQQAEIMRASTEAICGTISEGLDDVTDGLRDVESAIYRLTNLLDSRLKTIIDELKYNNLLSQNIALLLREPDSEKVRQKNIEKGLKFLNDSYRNPFFFNDSLLFLKKAVEDEQTGDHTDYFVLHKIGLVYLYSHEHVNFETAINYFNKAATYSEVDTHPDAIRLANILRSDVTKSLSGQNPTVDNIKYLTGESLMQIAIAYYIQGKLPDSIKYAERAFKIAPTLLEAGFILAKSLAASNQNDKAAEVLKPVIRQDSIYSIKTLNDRDLATKPEILQMNEELRMEEKNNSLALVEKSSQLKAKAINEWKIMESGLAKDFNELCKNIETATGFMNKDNYLSYLKAKKHLNHFISNL